MACSCAIALWFVSSLIRDHGAVPLIAGVRPLLEAIVMKVAVAIVLIAVGAIVILGPVVAHAYTDNRDKERIAEYYSSHSIAGTTGYASLPPDLRPTGYVLYDFGCWAAGVGMVVVGVILSRSKPGSTPA